jgi:hypothetical protein
MEYDMVIGKRPDNLKDHIHTILHGTATEKEKLQGQFFYLADTPQFMNGLGLTGEFFEIKYGRITRHKRKDNDHALLEQNWIDLCSKITMPFAISKYDDGYRLFINVRVNNNWIVIGVDVKRTKKNLEINSISTVFGLKKGKIDNVIYISEKITPEQRGLLDGHNSLSLPSVQEHNSIIA